MVSADPDWEYLMIDGSLVRVHPHGAPKTTEHDSEAVGKSRGGLSTKSHAAVDALGHPIRLILTAGQQFPPNPSPLKYWIKEPKSTRFYAFPVCFLFFRRVISMRFYPKPNSQA